MTHCPLLDATYSLFFFTAPAPTEIYTLSLHDALPIYPLAAIAAFAELLGANQSPVELKESADIILTEAMRAGRIIDRKSTRLNSSHMSISYAVFCLKKKKNHTTLQSCRTQGWTNAPNT